MDYNTHLQNIKLNFPDFDLLKESELSFFDDEKFAVYCIDFCLNLSNKAAKKLNINLNFGIRYNKTFNATAIIKKSNAVITFNFGLIEKLGIIMSETINLFLQENIAQITIDEKEKEELKQISIDCCLTYLFNHELAHIIQLLNINQQVSYNFHEKYYQQFELRRHIYEFDADLFGSMISTIELMKKVMNENHQFNTLILFNSLTCLLFSIANIIIEFSGNQFEEIYYKQNSHPHPFIRIIKINEQILENVSVNLKISKPFFETTLDRATKMISQILYTNKRTLDYQKFYNKNSERIESYVNEIEKENQAYKELTRYKPQGFYEKLFY